MLLHMRILSFQIRKGLCLTCRSGFPWSPTNTKLGRKEDFNIVVRAAQVPFRGSLRIQILSKRGENIAGFPSSKGNLSMFSPHKEIKEIFNFVWLKQCKTWNGPATSVNEIQGILSSNQETLGYHTAIIILGISFCKYYFLASSCKYQDEQWCF